MKRTINRDILSRAYKLKQDKRFIATDKALATVLGVNENTVATWRKSGVIPYGKITGLKAPVYNVRAVAKSLFHYKPEPNA